MRTLSAKEREQAFPVHIELGKGPGDGINTPVDIAPRGTKKGKSRKYYPTVYIDNMPGLEALPKEGCMLVDFRRVRMNIDTPTDGEPTAGVTLELRRLCLAEEADDAGDYAPDDLESALGRVGRKEPKRASEMDDEETETEDDNEDGE